MRQPGTRSLPQRPGPGDEFETLDAFQHAVEAAERALDPAVQLLMTKNRSDERRTFICKRGKRKTGRRKNGERRLDDDELCTFSISAMLDTERDPPTFVVDSFLPHHHLDVQLSSSSPARAPPQVKDMRPSSSLRRSDGPNRSASPSSNRRDSNGRFLSKASRFFDGSSTDFDIPLLAVCPRQRPPPSSSGFSASASSRSLADTDEYLNWQTVLGIGEEEVPRAWRGPVLKGGDHFALWGWAPKQGEDSDEGEDTQAQPDIVMSDVKAPGVGAERSLDDFRPQPKRRRRSFSSTSTSTSTPLVLSVRPTTRSELRGASRRSSVSTTISQSPELRRDFWAHEEETRRVTMTPETPMHEGQEHEQEVDEQEVEKGQGNEAEQEEDAMVALLELSGGSSIGLGIDFGEAGPEPEEEEKEAEEEEKEEKEVIQEELGSEEEQEEQGDADTPAILGLGGFVRDIAHSPLPFPSSALPTRPPRPPLRIDTKVDSSIFASPQPMTGLDSGTEDKIAVKPFANDLSLIAAIESTLPPQFSPSKLAPTPPWARTSFPRAPAPKQGEQEQRTDVADEHDYTSSPPLPPPPPPPPPPPAQVSSSPAVADEENEPAFGTLVFKPRRPKQSTKTNYKASKQAKQAKPALKVALASAENASATTAYHHEREDVKPDILSGVDMLQQREEVKQLQARFFAPSDSEIDPFYSGAHLEYKIASLRARGIHFSVNQAYANLLRQRPLRSQLPQPFLHVSREPSLPKPTPASARPLDPRLVAATTYVWGRELGKAEIEWLEKNEPALWRLLSEMIKARTINEKAKELGVDSLREGAREDSPGRGWSQQPPYDSQPQYQYGWKQGSRSGGGGGRQGWRGSSAEADSASRADRWL